MPEVARRIGRVAPHEHRSRAARRSSQLTRGRGFVSFLLRFSALATAGVLIASCGKGAPTSPSTTPINSGPIKISDTFVSFGRLDPKPLPEGIPMGLCGKEAQVSGTIKIQLTTTSGGGEIQLYLMTREDSDTLGCSPLRDVCPGAVDPVTFTGSVVKEWPVTPGKYCIMVRNRSTSVVVLDGGAAFEYFR